MLIEKNQIFKRENNKPILIDTFYQENKTKQPIVVFCHGYKGFKDWGAWDHMAKSIAKAGFCFIKFNFSHNGGTMENPIDFPDLEAFGNNNYTKELDDLDDVIYWAIAKFKENVYVSENNINLIGHSRGGGISIIKASEDERIKNLITLASVCDFAKRTATIGDLKKWKENGVKYVINGRTKQQMPHYYQFYEDFKANEERLNIESAEKRLQIPHLIIHGDKDTSVNIDEAYSLHRWNPHSHIQIIEGADHVFNIRHPWTKEVVTNEFSEAISHMVNFMQ
ncbi:alpha/beta hydrolase family protein [Winogradskyella aquimaris]|uniref:Alpha/beta fold hydrolase n=1 Tax=Winogradskyella aquimaris TaxID=864074 RepID=A0ABU5EMP1_9FLAO|nr:alpha/beta fold hydrolase [Winogradskyella aquimaris]MDY2586156.1 alpha/beta fold hydrolase [Winogradskyella aquimaris]